MLSYNKLFAKSYIIKYLANFMKKLIVHLRKIPNRFEPAHVEENNFTSYKYYVSSKP